MLGINSNINSLVAQQNLTGSQSALSQAITRLSSGKRINSAADDAAGLAISTGMQTQINGLNQGVSNANDGVSMIQTATSGLSQITASLQRIRQLATQASNGGLTDDNRAALQKEVTQQIAEVNRIASQTQYNGKNILDGTAGSVSFQVGANVGQTVSLDLSQNMSASKIGSGVPAVGNTLASFSVALNDSGAAAAKPGVSSITASWDAKANAVAYTDQNGNAITDAGTIAAYTAGASGGTAGATPAAGDPANTVTIAAGANATITQINVISDGKGGFTLTDQNNVALTKAAAEAVFGQTSTTATVKGTVATDPNTGATTLTGVTGANIAADLEAAQSVASGSAEKTTDDNLGKTIDTLNATTSVSGIDVSSLAGAQQAMLSIDNALNAVNNLQATLGAAQNRFTAISTTQQAQSTDLSNAQSQIQDANFAQETANLSKAQVLQQAGISVLAQANSLPQQVLKLLQ
ncbi:flagellin [Burkholderia pseudomultivorans]|uniref:flagellin N-terminal helical domain-containing protein n=1 Tax=Burkholderia pseudomultivorans TaxID=1207504 RepID=UPI002874FCDC|nr:flagellin [Burkholderia pseudomultivorans]MDS0857326.1 flagellin [Burkholderia pseudomultivorans]